MQPIRLFPLLLLGLASPAAAEMPRVLADTAPVHSLVAMVMGDLGTPQLIVPPGTSPHDASLSPSEAQALVSADLIVWTGEALLPWMGRTLDALAAETPRLALLEAEGWEPLPRREALHPDEGDHGDDHHHDHGAGGVDPHAWLDPAVAAAWLPSIAEALAETDPENAETYRRNAAEAADRLRVLEQELREELNGGTAQGYAVGHDAYRYLERGLGLAPAWALSDAEGTDPAPGHVSELRDAVLSGEVTCLLLDAESDPSWAETLGEGAELRSATVDPDGVRLEPGPDLYPTLMRSLASALDACLNPES